MKKSIDQIKLNKSGVFLVTTAGKKQIAAPIRFKAIGHRTAHDKKIAIAEITFVTRKGEKTSEYFDMSATLPRNRYKIIDALADAGYRWPTQRTLPDRIIEDVLDDEPDQSFTMVGAPGWYGDIMLTSRRQYGKGNRFVLDPNAGAHVARLSPLRKRSNRSRWPSIMANSTADYRVCEMGLLALFYRDLVRSLRARRL
jgi:hypothetical protein